MNLITDTFVWLVTPGLGLGLTFTLFALFFFECLGLWTGNVARHWLMLGVVFGIALLILWLTAGEGAKIWDLVFADLKTFLQFFGAVALYWVIAYVVDALVPNNGKYAGTGGGKQRKVFGNQ